jgi:hypothetical protein
VNLKILREAEIELSEAIGRYEGIEPGLGLRLKDEVRRALVWIQNDPKLPRLRANGYRRVNLKVFRFYIAYHIWADTIWVLAIAHAHRRPEYWIKRQSNL